MGRGGEIVLYTGPMFAGKSSALVRHVEVARHAGISCLVVVHESDTRYGGGDELTTHGGLAAAGSNTVRVVRASRLAGVSPGDDEETILVDEGQFFPDLAERCSEWAGLGHRVRVAALSSDFRREPFDNVARLAARAETVHMLHAACAYCRSEHAIFTVRVSDGRDRLHVGGSDDYRAACRDCYLEWQPAARHHN